MNNLTRTNDSIRGYYRVTALKLLIGDAIKQKPEIKEVNLFLKGRKLKK